MVPAILLLAALAAACAAAGLLLMRRGPAGRVSRLVLAAEERAGAPAHHGPPLLQRCAAPLRRLMPAASLAVYRLRLSQAGRPLGLDAERFLSLKLACAALLPALVVVVTLGAPDAPAALLLVPAGLAGYGAPDLWLNGLVARRGRRAQAELPLFADLVAAAICAGLPLPEAVRRVAADLDGLVAGEFQRAVLEMAAGKPRQAAWRDLIDRVPGEPFRMVVQSVMQAEQHGTSVAEILRYQVRQIRAARQAEAQRTAQAASVRIRIPMLLLILLPFMILLLGPALLQMAELVL